MVFFCFLCLALCMEAQHNGIKIKTVLYNIAKKTLKIANKVIYSDEKR